MKIGVVEFGGDLTRAFADPIEKEVANVSFVKKRALDLFDVLAFARKLSQDCDQVVMLVELDEEKKTENNAFYEGLAVLEADTGKPIFKLIYLPGEAGEEDAAELSKTFLNYVFGKS